MGTLTPNAFFRFGPIIGVQLWIIILQWRGLREVVFEKPTLVSPRISRSQLARSNFWDFLPSTLDKYYSVLPSNRSKSVNLSKFSFLCLSCSPHLPLQLTLTLDPLAAKLHKIVYLGCQVFLSGLLSVVVFPWSVAFIRSRSQAERRSVAGDRPG